MAVKKFNEIIAWQKAHQLAKLVYKLTSTFPKSELFALTSQLRRSAVSVPSNLVEGFARQTRNDSIHFYNIAQGSLEELKYQLLLSQELGYIPQDEYQKTVSLAEEVGKLIHGWIRVQN